MGLMDFLGLAAFPLQFAREVPARWLAWMATCFTANLAIIHLLPEDGLLRPVFSSLMSIWLVLNVCRGLSEPSLSMKADDGMDAACCFGSPGSLALTLAIDMTIFLLIVFSCGAETGRTEDELIHEAYPR